MVGPSRGSSSFGRVSRLSWRADLSRSTMVGCGSAASGRASAQIDKLVYSKMCGFFALFGIDPRKPGAWEQLAHAFFFQLPGLQITVEPPAKAKKGRGAPKKYNDVE